MDLLNIMITILVIIVVVLITVEFLRDLLLSLLEHLDEVLFFRGDWIIKRLHKVI